MKDNAPWQDRQDDPENDFKGGAARKGLRAYVVRDEAEEAARVEGREAAQALDDTLMRSLRDDVLARRERAKSRLNLYTYGQKEVASEKLVRNKKTGQIKSVPYTFPYVAPDPVRASRLRRAIKTQRQYKMPKAVPKGRSAVARFEREWKGKRSPLVTVKFTHNTRLTYVIWLEIANQGRYAIIARARKYWGDKLMSEIKSIANLKQYRDRIALGPQPTEREVFEQHVAKVEAFEGKPYEPWGPERKSRRIKRKRDYDPDEARENRERARIYEQGSGPALRTYQEKKPERMMSLSRLYPPR